MKLAIRFFLPIVVPAVQNISIISVQPLQELISVKVVNEPGTLTFLQRLDEHFILHFLKVVM